MSGFQKEQTCELLSDRKFNVRSKMHGGLRWNFGNQVKLIFIELHSCHAFWLPPALKHFGG